MIGLTIRATIIGGDKLDNDYCISMDGRGVGAERINDLDMEHQPLLPIPSWCNGSAGSFEAAKDQFKAAWESFYASLTPQMMSRAGTALRTPPRRMRRG